MFNSEMYSVAVLLQTSGFQLFSIGVRLCSYVSGYIYDFYFVIICSLSSHLFGVLGRLYFTTAHFLCIFTYNFIYLIYILNMLRTLQFANCSLQDHTILEKSHDSIHINIHELRNIVEIVTTIV